MIIYEKVKKDNINLIKRNEKDEDYLKTVLGFNPFLSESNNDSDYDNEEIMNYNLQRI